jgi:hypothetical protein
MREATGGHCLEIEAGCPASTTRQLDRAACMGGQEKRELMERAKDHAGQFERRVVFGRLLRLADGDAVVGAKE